MSWIKADLSDLPDLEKFLIAREVECVGFAAWLREKIISTPHIRNDFTIYLKRNKNHLIGDEAISEALLITDQGLIFPLVAKRAPTHLHDLSELARELHQYPSRINSIIGVTKYVATVEKLIKQEIRARVDYHLMHISRFGKGCRPPHPSADIKIRQATVIDSISLYDMQKNYEIEEVYINPELFNEAACFANLTNSLRKETIYIAERNSTPVAKAGTNARGYFVWQIGGVYTVPHDRRKGLGCLLMIALLKHVFQAGKSASLFVKKTNKPAISLYKKIGFDIVDSFRITYYKNGE